MVEKMIRNTKIEIIIVILFVIISIPVWQLLSNNLEKNLASAIKANTRLELILNKINDYDNLIVNNTDQSVKNIKSF